MVGRPPIGDRAMTPAERAKRYRDRKRREREAAPAAKLERRRKRDRKRAERAAVKTDQAATLPPAPDLPDNLVDFAESLTVSQGHGEGELLELLPWET